MTKKNIEGPFTWSIMIVKEKRFSPVSHLYNFWKFRLHVVYNLKMYKQQSALVRKLGNARPIILASGCCRQFEIPCVETAIRVKFKTCYDV